MIDQFAAFEQRPDNKLWLFYRKSGPFRLAKAYVFAYTWHEGRSGALAALHVALDEVEGKEVEKPQECLVESGSMVVFVNRSGFRVVETTMPMSGEDVRAMSKGEGELFDSIRERMNGLKSSNGVGDTSVEDVEVDDVERIDPEAPGDEALGDEDKDFSLRQLQASLPWTIRYSRDFRANPQTHKDVSHALLHVVKATGKLCALADDMDHDREVADDPTLRERYSKYVADLVVCALRIANEFPGGHIDLHDAVVSRIRTKNTPTGLEEETVEEDGNQQ